MTPRRLALALLSTAALLAVPLTTNASAQPEGQGPPPANVVVDPVRTQSLVSRRALTGEIVSTRRSRVAAQNEGYVIEFDLIEGDTVRRGDVIARLDDEIARLEVEQARARLAAAEGLVAQRTAEADRAERDLARMRTLEDRNSASVSELDEADTGAVAAQAMLTQAQADVSAARSALALADRRLRDKTIVAPFNAAVVARSTQLGEWLEVGSTVVELVALDTLEARVDVPERLLHFLVTEDRPIELRVRALAGTAEVEARLIDIIPLADSLSRSLTARLRPTARLLRTANAATESEGTPDANALLRPGMSLTALVPTGERGDFTTIHKDAILRDDAGSFVYAAMPLGGPGAPPQAMPVRVEVLFAEGDRLAVRAPQLRPGTDLLVEGNERVYPTQPLEIVNASPADSPAAGPAPANAPAN